MPKIFIFELYLVHPLCKIFHSYTLCGVLIMSKISFPDFIMPPKKKKTWDISHENKGVGRLYLEEHWSFVDKQLISDFILTHGHIWFHLITHQFDVGNLTSLILPLHTNDLSREFINNL